MNENQPQQPNLPTANNNPGDLKDPATGTFQQFSNPQEGFAALLNDLSYKMSPQDTKLGPNATLGDFSNVYAPASDGNDPAEYTAKLANQLGVAPNATLGSLEPKIGDFANAVANNEGYDDASDTDVSKDPKYQAISTNQNSMPTLEKWVLGGALTAGGIAAAAVTGGADLPEVAAGDAAIAGLGDAAGATAADAGATAGATAASGAADASEAEPGVISKLVGGAKNLAEGAATVSGAEGIAKYIFGGNQSQSQPTEQPTPTIDNTQLPDALGASRQIYSTMNEALGQTPTGRVYANTPAGQSGLQGLSEYGIAPEDVEGNYDSTQADEKAQTVLEGLSDNMGQVLDAEGESANLNEAISEATKGMKKVTPSNEWGEAEAHIKQQAETYRQFADENGNMSLGNFERMKKEQYRAAGKWDTTTTSAKKAAHKSLGLGARSTIVKHTKHKELYERAMHEEKKIINGRKILKKINGKKIKKKSGAIQSMLHNLGHYAAIAIGDKIGGPLGAIVGEVVGNTITRGIEKKYGSNILDTPAMKKALALVGKNKPQVLDIIKKEIKKYETMAQKEKEMSGKRAAYKEKKSAILNPKSKPSEYEPYQSPYTIAMGRRPKKKETLPVIRA
jgi:hypothetical protein